MGFLRTAMTQDVTVAMAAVRKWIGNPVSLRMLRFVAARDRCGIRLAHGIDQYLGKGKTDLCWRCRLAGRIVGWTLGKGGEIFGIGEKDMKETLGNPVFARGLVNVIEGIARCGITMPQVVAGSAVSHRLPISDWEFPRPEQNRITRVGGPRWDRGGRLS